MPYEQYRTFHSTMPYEQGDTRTEQPLLNAIRSAVCLRACYAISGTGIGSGATSLLRYVRLEPTGHNGGHYQHSLSPRPAYPMLPPLAFPMPLPLACPMPVPHTVLAAYPMPAPHATVPAEPS
eukprot:3380502-Rhodomonas_salina.1